MRVSMTSAQNSSVLIWAENKATKAQWQLEVKDITQHGPVGLPANVVLNLLKAKLVFFIEIGYLDYALAYLTNYSADGLGNSGPGFKQSEN